MDYRQSKLLRGFAFLAAFFCSLVITGCGGGGGNSVNPISPNSVLSGSIEGYVSASKISSSIRSSVAENIAQPLSNAAISLISIEALTGKETTLGTSQTDDKGYYQIQFLAKAVNPRNLILKAVGNGQSLECVLPQIKEGIVVRAPTIDPTTHVQSKIVREAAKFGKNGDVNLGEIMSVLTPAAISELESKIPDLVAGFVERDEATQKKLGAIFTDMKNYAFELQQTINDEIEHGKLTSSDAWKVFSAEMDEKAKSLGISSDDLKSLDDIDQAYLFEPFKKDLADKPSFRDGLGKIETDQLRERKIKFLALLADSVKILVKDKANSEFAGFFQLLEKIKTVIETAGSSEEIQRFFQNSSGLALELGSYLEKALLEAKFTADMVNAVFSIPVPQVGFGLSSSGTAMSADTSSTGGVIGSTANDSPTIAIDLITKQDDLLNQLIMKVREVVTNANISLTSEEVKAAAYIIMAQSSENLNFSAPPPLPSDTGSTDPSSPIERPNYDYTMSGTVETMSEFKTVDEVTYKFTHRLRARNYCDVSQPFGVTTKADVADAQIIAYLAATEPIELEKVDTNGIISLTKGTLDDLTQYELVEIEGTLVKSPYKPIPMPAPAEPTTTSGVDYASYGSDDKTTTTVGTTGSMPGNSGSGNDPSDTGITSPAYPAPITVYPELDQAYILVKKARILPPPPPSPIAFENISGKIIQPTANLLPVAGIFIFESADSLYNGSLLQQAGYDLESLRLLDFSQWAGKPVSISGTLIQQFDSGGSKVIIVRSLQGAN